MKEKKVSWGNEIFEKRAKGGIALDTSRERSWIIQDFVESC